MRRSTLSVLLLASSLTSLSTAQAGYLLRNLASNQPGLATVTDANLVNPIGISLSPTGGAFWICNQGSNTATLYSGDANGSAFTKTNAPFQAISIPGGSPTGQVFAGAAAFPITNGVVTLNASFIFASNSGRITGWNANVAPNTTAKVAVDASDPDYTGLALASNAGSNFLYAADFRAGRIDTYNTAFAPTALTGNFVDPTLPAGYAPFNIQRVGSRLLVTYARKSDGSLSTGAGLGIVSAFNTDGTFISRLVSDGAGLNAPWGLALAPSTFGEFANALLVANHGDGRILAFDNLTGAPLGAISTAAGTFAQDGLWGLAFGNGVTAGSSSTLYLSAGPNGGANGLFSAISVPEPTLLPALLLAPALFLRRARRHSNAL